MPSPSIQTIKIKSEDDIVLARTAVRELAAQHGFSIMSKTRIATAVSELARNVYLHGDGGYMEVETVVRADTIGIRCVFVDHGPGIANIDQAMLDGFSSTSTLGHGLPGSKRLVDEFDIQSKVGQGVRVEVIKWF